MMSSHFKKMVDAAEAHDQPQRLLIMLAKSDIDSDNEEGMSGTISPVICVDKTPDEITTFEDFVAEADAIDADWDMMFIAGLAGENNEMPTPEQADPVLNQMVDDLMSGQNLSSYLVLDRNEVQVELFTEQTIH